MKGIIARLLLCIVALLAVNSFAQDPDVTLKDIVESNVQAAEEAAQIQREQPMSTPLGAVLLIRDAGLRQQWERMAEYADFRYVEPDVLEQGPGNLMRKLALMWEQYQIFELTAINDTEEGNLKDGLPPYRELLGSLNQGSEQFDILLQRVPDANGNKVWKISNATVAQIPQMWDNFGYPPQLEQLEQWLPEFRLFHMRNWQVLMLVVIVVAGWLITALIRWILLKIVTHISIYGDTMQRLIRQPLRRFLFFCFVNWAVYQLGLPLKVRVIFDSGFLAYLAGMFLVLGIVEFWHAVYIARAMAKDENFSPGFIRPLVTIVKILVIIFAVLLWLQNAGYNMATILTGLGIGSLAVALAAQKTLENVFGAFTLFIARPIKPGDFCRFGPILGTVEEIGLRSTMLRKLDRTLVSVPNSIFSVEVLENLSKIDQRLYRQSFYLATDVEAGKLESLLADMNSVLEQHERVLFDARRVRFERVEREGFVVQANAYINTDDYSVFLQVAEQLNLQLLAVIEQHDITLARWLPEVDGARA
ncbi:mechanosensitive ion channel family protein [Gilvimarinus agarilyticus]|uniref:mechanosensitive ion channel family protein n=1 Tax=Gilvimarinus agarilyticus TaxID=679259 RepID=UPI0005A02049|nr:mechanosensitive ion channel domain-containing protein [Gilvimarinus agarilyticus]